ncbi:MAG: hypothetical protein AAFX93_10490 [Verrucomicrobiota bacterium]
MKSEIATLIAGLVTAQSLCAQFITPDYREDDFDENFAYWVGFDVAYTPEQPPYTGLGFDDVNIPFAGGNQNARLAQDEADAAIITSTGGIYSFQEGSTSYKVYDNPDYSPGSILFQTATLTGSQSLPDLSSAKLFYRTSSSGPWVEADIPIAAALESSNSTGDQFTVWEWDTSSLLIADYYIQFSYSLNHSSFIEAQLDTHESYEQQLDGFSINVDTNIPFGLLFGVIDRSPEKLIYNAGESVTLEVVTNSSFQFVKWIGDFGESTDNPMTITIDDNLELQAILAPVNYQVWRQIAFPAAHGSGADLGEDWASDFDFDLDGRINLIEYAFGGTPVASDLETKQIELRVIELEGKRYPAIEFAQQVAANDLTYDVASSSDLQSWQTNNDPGAPFVSDPEIISLNNDGTKQVLVRSLTPLDSENQRPFLQLLILAD